MNKHYSELIGLLILVFLTILVPTKVVSENYRFSEDPDEIEKAADSVFMLEVYSSQNQRIGVGSGFIAIDDNLMITNYHVIEDGSYIVAVSDDNNRYAITDVCISSKKNDIAILYFDNPDQFLPLEMEETDQLKRSQTVVAIGSPAGLMNTISIGNISAFYKRDGHDWIQFTAPISSGSSGGALLNDQGKVIGITTATYASAQNVNMAVRSDYVLSLFHQWDGRTTMALNRMYSKPASSILQTITAQSEDSSVVYVTPSGKKYHNSPTCSRMKNPMPINLMDAIEKGYLPCDKCYK